MTTKDSGRVEGKGRSLSEGRRTRIDRKRTRIRMKRTRMNSKELHTTTETKTTRKTKVFSKGNFLKHKLIFKDQHAVVFFYRRVLFSYVLSLGVVRSSKLNTRVLKKKVTSNKSLLPSLEKMYRLSANVY